MDNSQKPKPKKKKGLFNIQIGGGSPLNVALSIRHLSIMLKSGLALQDAIEVLTDQANDQKLKDAYTDIAVDIAGGMTLADAMQKHRNVFSETVISIIKVGEEGGTLEKNLIFLADYLKKDYELSKKVKGALVYPMIVLGLTVVEMLGVVYFILPKLETLFNSFESEDAGFAKFIIVVATFIRTNGPILLVVLLVIGILFRAFLKTKTGQRLKDKVAIRFPVFKNLVFYTVLTSFSRTLGILLQSGIPLANALEITSGTTTNSIYKKIFDDVFNRVKSGQNLADSLREHSNRFSPTYVKMIEVGESTGTLEENLNYLYEFYADELTEMSNNLTTLLEPLLLIFIGLMIGSLAIAIVGPIYQLTSSIN